MLIQIFLLIIFAIILALSTSLVLRAMKQLARLTGLQRYALANLVLAMGTSFPELLVAIQSALAKEPSLSLGNILGSNIADLSVVIGGATLIGGSLAISKNVINSDIYYTFLIAAAPLLLLIDGQLDRLDGILLLLLFSFWQTISLGKKRERRSVGILEKIKEKLLNHRARLSFLIAKLIIGLAGLLAAAHQLVNMAHSMAIQFKISPLIVGIFIIGLGSSLPELAVEARAISKKEAAVALGDLFGSVVINSSLILGITTLIYPINLTQPRLYFFTTIFFLIIFSIFYLFIRTRAQLERWEGAILLMLYFILVAIELT